MVLFGAGRWLDARRGDQPKPRRDKSEPAGELPAGRAPRGKPVIDDDLADIEAILKKRGIT